MSVFLHFFEKRGCQRDGDLYNAASPTRQSSQGFSAESARTTPLAKSDLFSLLESENKKVEKVVDTET